MDIFYRLFEKDPKKPSAHLEGANRGDVSYKVNEGKVNGQGFLFSGVTGAWKKLKRDQYYRIRN